MKIFSLTCTRAGELSNTTTDLLEYFKRCNIQSKLLVDKSSIFTAYDEGIDELHADHDDIIILCHDDIRILTDPTVFTTILKEKLTKPDTGFVGVAGTTILSNSGIWWDQEFWQKGKHSGCVIHGLDLVNPDDTYFGKLGQVSVLDGVFLATTKKTLRSIQLTKPSMFEGSWDFYDIFYTIQTHLKKKKNFTVPIQIMHESRGELVGRDSWHKNRQAFCAIFKDHLPTSVS
tara:strand:- start:3784 stop:4476 length:693 start_codon:yes stop_codon:yes gene_type:complete